MPGVPRAETSLKSQSPEVDNICWNPCLMIFETNFELNFDVNSESNFASNSEAKELFLLILVFLALCGPQSVLCRLRIAPAPGGAPGAHRSRSRLASGR